MRKGMHNSPETIAKISKSMKGRHLSPEHIAKMSDAMKGEKNPNFGKHHSPEARKKMSTYHKGKMMGAKNPMYGKHHSPETKAKLFMANKGKRIGEKHPMFGKHPSVDTLKKMSKSMKGKHHSPEARTKISDAMKGEKNPMYGRTREKHPMWNNGSSFEPYSTEFNNSLKERIRDRDHHTCQLCGKSEHDNGRRLDIHHCDYDKNNCRPENLLGLCRNCNSKVNKDRPKWTKHFQELLTSRQERIILVG